MHCVSSAGIRKDIHSLSTGVSPSSTCPGRNDGCLTTGALRRSDFTTVTERGYRDGSMGAGSEHYKGNHSISEIGPRLAMDGRWRTINVAMAYRCAHCRRRHTCKQCAAALRTQQLERLSTRRREAAAWGCFGARVLVGLLDAPSVRQAS